MTVFNTILLFDIIFISHFYRYFLTYFLHLESTWIYCSIEVPCVTSPFVCISPILYIHRMYLLFVHSSYSSVCVCMLNDIESDSVFTIWYKCKSTVDYIQPHLLPTTLSNNIIKLLCCKQLNNRY